MERGQDRNLTESIDKEEWKIKTLCTDRCRNADDVYIGKI